MAPRVETDAGMGKGSHHDLGHLPEPFRDAIAQFLINTKAGKICHNLYT